MNFFGSTASEGSPVGLGRQLHQKRVVLNPSALTELSNEFAGLDIPRPLAPRNCTLRSAFKLAVHDLAGQAVVSQCAIGCVYRTPPRLCFDGTLQKQNKTNKFTAG
ncbi:uncharacterized protein PV09_03785 [Verruconis gallopava]|uniref:Uncharacterized protein n=1 Tax=Verruconis gallopava TaxID=253628 RepID=A0A0D1XRD0_9PEZI|nr:uncharacterized protein PV09_03785 [Verruconis gallopava]KIW05251.1 hypothetical protein PV09_03785 [Verruconis gallopava]